MGSDLWDIYDWYDDDILETVPGPTARAVAGLPKSWWNYDWWLLGIAYGGLWLLESWTSGGGVLGKEGLLHMAYGAATLLLALAACSVLFRICSPFSKRLGKALSVAAGITLLLGHSFSTGF